MVTLSRLAADCRHSRLSARHQAHFLAFLEYVRHSQHLHDAEKVLEVNKFSVVITVI